MAAWTKSSSLNSGASKDWAPTAGKRISVQEQMLATSGNPRLSARAYAPEFKELSVPAAFDELERERFEDQQSARKSLMAAAARRSMMGGGQNRDSTRASYHLGNDRPISIESDRVMFEPEYDTSQFHRASQVAPRSLSVDASEMGDELLEKLKEQSLAYCPAFAWVERETFQGCIITVILLNICVLAVETDYPNWPYWDLLNALFLFVYIIELGLRMVLHGPKGFMFRSKGRRQMALAISWYDIFVVAIGCIDLVVATQTFGKGIGVANFAAEHHREELMDEKMLAQQLEDEPGHTARQLSISLNSPIVRVLQLTRLLRGSRIITIIPDLFAFVKMLISMILFGTIWYIFIVMGSVGFVLAIILTRLLGHGMLVGEDDPHYDPQVHAMFADIPTSMFTLFKLTTCDNWNFIAQPVFNSFEDRPFIKIAWRVFFITFITFMCWTMLSLLTAVASETMISDTTAKKDDAVVTAEANKQAFITFLCEEFLLADQDKSGNLDKEEFTVLMGTPRIKHMMKQHGVDLEERDIERTWDTFDVDESGQLDITEIVDGFALLQEGLATKHVASIGYSLKRFSLQLDQDMEYLETGVDKLEAQQMELINEMQNSQKIYQDQWVRFLQNQTQEAMLELEKATPFLDKTLTDPTTPTSREKDAAPLGSLGTQGTQRTMLGTMLGTPSSGIGHSPVSAHSSDGTSYNSKKGVLRMTTNFPKRMTSEISSLRKSAKASPRQSKAPSGVAEEEPKPAAKAAPSYRII